MVISILGLVRFVSRFETKKNKIDTYQSVNLFSLESQLESIFALLNLIISQIVNLAQSDDTNSAVGASKNDLCCATWFLKGKLMFFLQFFLKSDGISQNQTFQITQVSFTS